MKRLLAVAVAIAAVTMFSQSNAEAQQYNHGYQFGSGISALNGFGGGCCGYNSREQLPYFAKFPPVYYSNIVARPVGISPYAAPAGIRPIEMDYAKVKNVTVSNPYFDRKAAPVKTTPIKKKSINQKTTWIVNPYLESVVNR